MKRILPNLFGVLAVFLTLHPHLSTLHAQGTAFTYQGRLNDGANPANGAYDLSFALFNASSGGATLGATNFFNDLLISNSLFTVTLDYGAQFDSNPRWLQIAVRSGASAGAYTNLAPRQPLSPSPYAVLAGTVSDGAITGSKIDSTTVQRRVTGSAPGGSFLTGINQDGTVTTSVGGGGVWSLNGASAYYNGGNVGIGINTPSSKLHLFGSSDALRLTGSQPFLTLDDTPAGLYSRIQADGAGMNFKTQGAVTGSNPRGLIHLDGVGNVGIGTTTPLTRLSVAGAGAYNDPAAAAITLDNTTPTTGRRWEWHALDDGRMQLADVTGAATRMVIDTSGNVGIGAVTPGSKLEVAGNSRINGRLSVNANPDAMMTIRSDTAPSNPLIVYDYTGVELMRLGAGSPGYLQMSGDAYKPGGGSWSATSDARVKKNIQPMNGALDKLTQLRGVSFEWVNPADHANQHGPQGGFIAQEVERTFPQWITPVTAAKRDQALTDDGKIKSVTLPFEFDALVVEAIKEQQQQIKARDTEIEELKKRLDAMEKLLNRLTLAKAGDGR